MQKAKLMLTGLTFLGIAALAGCSFPGVYKIDIQQGNVVTQDMIDQLRPGMTQRQVRFIMGNPLIVDTFHPNRWDYLYSIQPGGGERQQERMTLLFDDAERLVGLSGDYRPGTSREESILGKPLDVVPVVEEPVVEIVSEEAPIVVDEPVRSGSLLERLQNILDDAEPAPVPEVAPLEEMDAE